MVCAFTVCMQQRFSSEMVHFLFLQSHFICDYWNLSQIDYTVSTWTA